MTTASGFARCSPRSATVGSGQPARRPNGETYRASKTVKAKASSSRPAPLNALSATECERVLAELNSRRFVDKSVGQCWATLLDEGTYLCSMSTMHRLLRRTGQAGDRRRQATHPPRARPELLAIGPLQVCGAGISPNSADHSVYYDLYVILDIFSRYVVGDPSRPGEERAGI